MVNVCFVTLIASTYVVIVFCSLNSIGQ